MKSLTSSQSGVASVIGKTVEINGSVFGEESLVIEGHISGEVVVKDHLTITKEGSVSGDVEVIHLELLGEIDGDVLCQQGCKITQEAHMKGLLKTETLSMDAGARFNGTVEMSFDLPTDI